jgi:hypothetical protein
MIVHAMDIPANVMTMSYAQLNCTAGKTVVGVVDIFSSPKNGEVFFYVVILQILTLSQQRCWNKLATITKPNYVTDKFSPLQKIAPKESDLYNDCQLNTVISDSTKPTPQVSMILPESVWFSNRCLGFFLQKLCKIDEN